MNIRKNNQGFTLIELLIVVVIIGILAAIAIPRFSSTKGKAFDAAAKTDLRNAMTAQEAYYSDFQLYGATGEPGRHRVDERDAGRRRLGGRLRHVDQALAEHQHVVRDLGERDDRQVLA